MVLPTETGITVEVGCPAEAVVVDNVESVTGSSPLRPTTVFPPGNPSLMVVNAEGSALEVCSPSLVTGSTPPTDPLSTGSPLVTGLLLTEVVVLVPTLKDPADGVPTVVGAKAVASALNTCPGPMAPSNSALSVCIVPPPPLELEDSSSCRILVFSMASSSCPSSANCTWYL